MSSKVVNVKLADAINKEKTCRELYQKKQKDMIVFNGKSHTPQESVIAEREYFKVENECVTAAAARVKIENIILTDEIKKSSKAIMQLGLENEKLREEKRR